MKASEKVIDVLPYILLIIAIIIFIFFTKFIWVPPLTFFIIIILSPQILPRRLSLFLIGITSLVFIIWMIYSLGNLIVPFVLSLVGAFLLDPLVDRGTKLKIPRVVSILIIFVLTAGVVAAILYLIVPEIIKESKQLIVFIQDLPSTGYDEFIDSISPYITPEMKSKITEIVNDKLIENALSIVENIFSNVSTTFKGISVVISSLISVILIPILTFYTLKDYNKLSGFVKERIPNEYRKDTLNLIDEVKIALSGYIRGQMTMMFIEGSFLALGLTLLDVKFGVIIGYITGLLNIIPYVGAIIGLIIALISASFHHNPTQTLILTALLYLVVFFVDSYIIGPKVVGDKVGLHPVIIIFVIFAGAHFFGIIGFFIAVPVAAIVKILLKYIFKKS